MSSPTTPYSKPFLELTDQIALLESRGLMITDASAAQKCLRRIGYYRLMAYLYPFREPRGSRPPSRSDKFLPDSRFEDAIHLYVFDKKLKMLVMDAIERVEVAVRVELSLVLGRRGAFAYLDPTQLHPNFLRFPKSIAPGPSKSITPDFVTWVNKMSQLPNRSKEDFVAHFKRKYDFPMPIWMACELWDFGMMSTLYSGLLLSDKQAIADQLAVANHELLESWLRSLNVIRNIVAHHGRLWNRTLGVSPALPGLGVMPDFDVMRPERDINKRIYFALCILSHLLKIINPTSSWKNRVVELADAFPIMPHAQLNSAGFPANWKTHAFWN